MNDHDFIKRITDATVTAIEEKILEVELALATDPRPRTPESIQTLAELYSRRCNLLGRNSVVQCLAQSIADYRYHSTGPRVGGVQAVQDDAAIAQIDQQKADLLAMDQLLTKLLPVVSESPTTVALIGSILHRHRLNLWMLPADRDTCAK